MKKVLYWAYFIILALVMVGKIMNWFLNFDDQTNYLLNTAMFCLIGIGYITMNPYTFNKQWAKTLTTLCGCYIIVMNFIEMGTLLTIIGILCIITPTILVRVIPKGLPEQPNIQQTE